MRFTRKLDAVRFTRGEMGGVGFHRRKSALQRHAVYQAAPCCLSGSRLQSVGSENNVLKSYPVRFTRPNTKNKYILLEAPGKPHAAIPRKSGHNAR